MDPITGEPLPPVAARVVGEEEGWLLDHFSASELRRVLAQGTDGLRASVWRAVGSSLALCLGTVAWVLTQIGDPAQPPGVLVTLSVVLAGLALSGTCFHLLRLGPARRLHARGLPVEIVRAQLEGRDWKAPVDADASSGGPVGTERS